MIRLLKSKTTGYAYMKDGGLVIRRFKAFGQWWWFIHDWVLPSPKHFLKYTLPRFIAKQKAAIKFWWKYQLLSSTVYYRIDETDCDLVNCITYGQVESLKAFKGLRDQVYSWAEGPTRIDIITREEYMDGENSRVDRIMESFENGNGRSHIV